MADMDVGNQLAQLPLGNMVEGVGLAIASAQSALDENTVVSLQKLAETTLEVNGTKKNLIEFGLVPSFYHFTEATLDFKFSMSMSTKESKKLDVSGKAKGKADLMDGKAGFAVAASLNMENTRKYGFSAEGSTQMSLKLVAVPPPVALMTAIQPAEKPAENVVEQ